MSSDLECEEHGFFESETGVQLCHACHEATHEKEREQAYRALYGGA